MTHKEVLEERGAAWIEGTRASPARAAESAARLLSASAQPLIAGLGADVDGARRAVALAERVGGVIDHMHSAAILRDLDSLRETGVMITTPGEARIRADVLVLVGDGAEEAWPTLSERLPSGPARSDSFDAPRRLVVLSTGRRSEVLRHAGPTETIVLGEGARFAAGLAALRAQVKGRRVMAQPDSALPNLDSITGQLKRARFGVAIWSASNLDALEIEMINGLVRDLNDFTRFSSFPLPRSDNGAGVLAVCGWMTGFPMRTGFGTGAPIHDPWRFDSRRLVESGEADCVLWISAFGVPPPEWAAASISIALCDRSVRLPQAPKVRIEVGRPGVDHDAVLHCLHTDVLVAVRAASPSANAPPSVGEALALIAGSLHDEGAEIC
jgi:formylmethanofuran dehydrogenase subunit B